MSAWDTSAQREAADPQSLFAGRRHPEETTAADEKAVPLEPPQRSEQLSPSHRRGTGELARMPPSAANGGERDRVDDGLHRRTVCGRSGHVR
jgi:hypothetical protein